MLVPILAALPGDRLLFVSIRAKAPLSSCLCARSERMTVVSGDTMANYSYILFNVSLAARSRKATLPEPIAGALR